MCSAPTRCVKHRFGGNMAEKAKKPVMGNSNAGQGANVAQQQQADGGPKICKSEGCKHKPEKFGFCKEHHNLFMEGIIRADGKKPIDFEEKLALYKRTHKNVA
jgi:hypothetical protein